MIFDNFDDFNCFDYFVIARGHDCLYFGHGNSNKLVLCADKRVLEIYETGLSL